MTRLLNNIESLLTFVAGDPKRDPLEQRIFNTLSLLNGILNLGGALSVFHLDNFLVLFALNFSTGILYILLWYISRLSRSRRMHYWPFAVLTLLFLATNWMTNAGSQGGSHYYMIAAAVFMVILSRKPVTTVLSFLLFVATSTLLFYVEYNYPEWITGLGTREDRYLDLYLNYTFVQVFSGSLVLILAINLNQERHKSENLLKNILPESIAEELIRNDRVEPGNYDECSVLFTDFSGFTALSEKMSARDLVRELDGTFQVFDGIMRKYGIEKIKTIGDSYMAVAGIPEPVADHAERIVKAALEIRDVMKRKIDLAREEDRPIWDIRIGIHSGPLVAGVIGTYKFAYDVWGDTVNTASRMESSGEKGRINISRPTFERIRGKFHCEYRGPVRAKGKGDIEMYFVEGPATESTT